MIIKRELGEKGQVVIPKDIRHLLGLKKGAKIVFEVKDNEVLIRQEKDVDEFLKEFFTIARLKKNLTIKGIKEKLGEQYELP